MLSKIMETIFKKRSVVLKVKFFFFFFEIHVFHTDVINFIHLLNISAPVLLYTFWARRDFV